jgi:t-SNARE complex subunit (syntaxin)
LIRSKIRSIDEGRDDLWKLSSQSMVSVSDEQVADLSGRLELVAGRTNKNADEIRGLLKELSTRNAELERKRGKAEEELGGACLRIRKVQVDALVRKFTESLGAFEATENSIQEKSRELLVRRFQIVEPTLATDDVIKTLAATGDGDASGALKNVFAFAAGGTGDEDVAKKLDHLRAQQRSMQRLEKNILALNKMFLDMQDLVLAQDNQLNHIETYTQRTLEYQKSTNLERAIEYQKNIRKVR